MSKRKQNMDILQLRVGAGYIYTKTKVQNGEHMEGLIIKNKF